MIRFPVNETVRFKGPTSQLSHFYPIKIIHDNGKGRLVEYVNAEQFYQSTKAYIFNDLAGYKSLY